MSFWSIAFLGTTTIGGPVVGWFAGYAGPRWGLALGGLAALSAALLGAVTLPGAKSRFSEPEEMEDEIEGGQNS